MKEIIKRIYIISFIILFTVVFYFLISEGYIKFSLEKGVTFGKYTCPYYIASGSHHGDIHMPKGTIFGYKSEGGEMLYDIIGDDTFIMSAYFIEDFKRIKCFGTEKEAVAMGYKKFLSNQAARKKQRLELREWLDKPPDEKKKDCENQGLSEEECSAKLLWAIDAAIGVD